MTIGTVATDTTATVEDTATDDPSDSDSDTGNNAGLIIGGLALVGVLGAGAYLVVRSRNRKA